MPLYRHDGRLVYFAHVPKCGCQSVEAYLARRWGPGAFLDDRFLDRLPSQRWSRSSPQHIAWADLIRLIPQEWITASFAVVRHPLVRLVSAYNYLSRHRRNIPAGLRFEDWAADLPHILKRAPFSYDNHLRRQSQLVPPDAEVVKLEGGLDALLPVIDRISGNSEGPRAIGHLNRSDAMPDARPTRREPVATDRVRPVVTRLYAEDFERFGYAPDPEAPLFAHVPTAPTCTDQPLQDRSRLFRRVAIASARSMNLAIEFGQR